MVNIAWGEFNFRPKSSEVSSNFVWDAAFKGKSLIGILNSRVYNSRCNKTLFYDFLRIFGRSEGRKLFSLPLSEKSFLRLNYVCRVSEKFNKKS